MRYLLDRQVSRRHVWPVFSVLWGKGHSCADPEAASVLSDTTSLKSRPKSFLSFIWLRKIAFHSEAKQENNPSKMGFPTLTESLWFYMPAMDSQNTTRPSFLHGRHSLFKMTEELLCLKIQVHQLYTLKHNIKTLTHTFQQQGKIWNKYCIQDLVVPFPLQELRDRVHGWTKPWISYL